MSRPAHVSRNLHRSLLAAAVLLASAAALHAAGGRPAHNLQLIDINPRSATHGELVELKSFFSDSGLVLQFVASWCQFCRQELPQYQELHASGRTSVVFVAADEGAGPDNILILAERNELTAPILFASAEQAKQVAQHYSYETLPATYFIDQRGRIRTVHQGSLDAQSLQRKVGSVLPVPSD